MSITSISSAQISALKPEIINIEVDVSKGLHTFSIVGLAHKSVEEAKDRISSAIKNSGFISPKKRNLKVVIALAPANIKKEGSGFDLAIALGYLAATGDIAMSSDRSIFLGELSLDGTLRSVRGTLAIIQEAKKYGYTSAFVPFENAAEAKLVSGIHIHPVSSLREVISQVDTSQKALDAFSETLPSQNKFTKTSQTDSTSIKISSDEKTNPFDFAHIRGHKEIKRVLEIAAAGRHHVALSGPPGTGKTLLARTFGSILPKLSQEEMLEVASIHSAAGEKEIEEIDHYFTPPFRSPHHTASYASIIGGGSSIRPGEITLAHKGILFMDEFPEFDRRVIDSLRQPLEEKTITVSRTKSTVRFPCDFILTIAFNPCPCGYYQIQNKKCVCPISTVESYRRKISGPIADRIDLWTDVHKIAHEDLLSKASEESSAEICARVGKARKIQAKRFMNQKCTANADMSFQSLPRFAQCTIEAEKILNDWAKKLFLSARSYHRTVKVARTIADLAGTEKILPEHMLEALQYRKREEG